MGRINRSGAATRARILESATRVLAEEGLSGFTLQAVATRAGILYGNLTHHYPTRETLIDGMFAHLVEGYDIRFSEMTQLAQDQHATVRDMVTWLLDDAVSDSTAPVFLQLWAMASSTPSVAAGMARLYDSAVDAFMRAFGVEPHGEAGRDLRHALYFLGMAIEGSSSIFWTRDRTGQAFRDTARQIAIDTLTTVIEDRLDKARAMAVR